MINKPKFNLEKNSSKFLLLLISADILFIFLHCLAYTGIIDNPLLYITVDRSAGEIFQYIKEYWIILMFAWLAIYKFNLLYLSWSMLFGYLLVDDSFQIHEKLGAALVTYFTYSAAFGLRAQDFGELTVSIFFGSILLCLIGFAYYYSTENLKKTCRYLLLLLGMLALFGIFADLVHVFFRCSGWGRALGVIEDGGEMLVMSVFCWFVFRLFTEKENDGIF